MIRSVRVLPASLACLVVVSLCALIMDWTILTTYVSNVFGHLYYTHVYDALDHVMTLMSVDDDASNSRLPVAVLCANNITECIFKEKMHLKEYFLLENFNKDIVGSVSSWRLPACTRQWLARGGTHRFAHQLASTMAKEEEWNAWICKKNKVNDVENDGKGSNGNGNGDWKQRRRSHRVHDDFAPAATVSEVGVWFRSVVPKHTLIASYVHFSSNLQASSQDEGNQDAFYYSSWPSTLHSFAHWLNEVRAMQRGAWSGPIAVVSNQPALLRAFLIEREGGRRLIPCAQMSTAQRALRELPAAQGNGESNPCAISFYDSSNFAAFEILAPIPALMEVLDLENHMRAVLWRLEKEKSGRKSADCFESVEAADAALDHLLYIDVRRRFYSMNSPSIDHMLSEINHRYNGEEISIWFNNNSVKFKRHVDDDDNASSPRVVDLVHMHRWLSRNFTFNWLQQAKLYYLTANSDDFIEEKEEEAAAAVTAAVVEQRQFKALESVLASLDDKSTVLSLSILEFIDKSSVSITSSNDQKLDESMSNVAVSPEWCRTKTLVNASDVDFFVTLSQLEGFGQSLQRSLSSIKSVDIVYYVNSSKSSEMKSDLEMSKFSQLMAPYFVSAHSESSRFIVVVNNIHYCRILSNMLSELDDAYCKGVGLSFEKNGVGRPFYFQTWANCVVTRKVDNEVNEAMTTTTTRTMTTELELQLFNIKRNLCKNNVQCKITSI